MSEPTTFSYWIADQGQDRDDCYTMSAKLWDREDAATEAGQDYFNSHDGWESRWPLEITVLVDGVEETFSVEMEAQPCFYARSIKPSGPTGET